MASLTPKERKEEVTGSAMSEGVMNGSIVLGTAMGGLFVAMRNPNFRKFTNWQSRTAIVIMPALFTFALTSELKMDHRMHEVAEETEFAMKSVEWADQEMRRRQRAMGKEAQDRRAMYRQAVLGSGITVVDTPELQSHHKAANFIQTNPFKCIGAVAVPGVAYVFRAQKKQEHLSLQMKLLHTRVLGQATVLITLLGIMGLKEMMDRRGKYVTEADVEDRVRQMESTRDSMMERLEYEANQRNMRSRLQR
ncbi:unnamed protein product [Cylindrotheca closterium]|uniref:HIG1 domain-containing protein n=1 Tax=Cylindrotheca closterium TaxID=2856 RepID=A0AAD2G855_9STRA|nr:unnamed protein product [Cylindrotheca closterium]